jgi:hypothetical protein
MTVDLTATRLPLHRANPHIWGPGKVHQIATEKQRTLCGKSRAACPGTPFWGVVTDISCKACLNAREAAARQIEQQRRHMEWQRQQAEETARWWTAYNEYLASPIWLEKRRRVLERAHYVCEGCAIRRAAQVHHLHYPRGMLPGTPEWIEQEMLFDLRAICAHCHDTLHPEHEHAA